MWTLTSMGVQCISL